MKKGSTNPSPLAAHRGEQRRAESERNDRSPLGSLDRSSGRSRSRLAQETIPSKECRAIKGVEQEEAEKQPLAWLGYAEEARGDGVDEAIGSGEQGNASN